MKVQETGTIKTEILIIGGGITGAAILHEASVRNIQAVLIEKDDFSSGTTQATSKLIHGGLRYLKNGDFKLVHESLRERRILASIAPHMVQPMPFLLPVYSLKDRMLLGAGLKIYDVLSFGKNKSLPPEQMAENSRFLGKISAINENRRLMQEGLHGSWMYYDYLNKNPERLSYLFIRSAKNRGAKAFNYSKLSSIQKKDDLYIAEVIDLYTKKKASISAKYVVNASGPWADEVESISGLSLDTTLIRSLGIHIITDRIVTDKTIALQTPNKKHLFIIPWRNHTLIGTTDKEFKGKPDDFQVTKSDIVELIDDVNQVYHANLTINDVKFFYGGLRPLVGDPNQKGTYNLSRKNDILSHEKSGNKNFYTVLGGKYTTSRGLAEMVIDRISKGRADQELFPNTEEVPLPGGEYVSQESLLHDLHRQFGKVERKKIYSLAERYGSLTYKILKDYQMKGYTDPYNVHGEVFYPEEIHYLIVEEDIRNPEDLFFRRSGIGTLGNPGDSCMNGILELYAKVTKQKQSNEWKKNILKHYQWKE